MKQGGFFTGGKVWLVVSIFYLAIVIFLISRGFITSPVPYQVHNTQKPDTTSSVAEYPPLDKADYNYRIDMLANNPALDIATGTNLVIITTSTPKILWPVQTAYPDNGAILPFKRIIAYYGNFDSASMGILGEYPEAVVLQKLEAQVAQWDLADPSTPAIPAIDYIAVTAQGTPGPDGKYRLRMPADQIEKAISMAGEVNGLVFLDVQVGQSNLQTEVPLLRQYLELPQVNLAIDPEFALKPGQVPGTVIGTMDASDINYTINYLAQIVDEYHLPPKILVVHRFTPDMVTNYQDIKIVPEVQVVINMDGWGLPAKKIESYNICVYSQPVEFGGIKLFFKNDVELPGSTMLTPAEILKLQPIPIYIQYQ